MNIFSDSDTEVDGCLGGLQLLDLTQEDVKHQKVFSVGLDPDQHSPHMMEIPVHLRADMYKTAHETFLSDLVGTDKALSFNYHKPGSESKNIFREISLNIYLQKKSNQLVCTDL